MFTPKLSVRGLKFTALLLALAAGACRPDMSSRVRCDQFEYIGPGFTSSAALGRYSADLADRGEQVRQVDAHIERSLAGWNTVCEEINAGVRDHDELRSATQVLRRLNARLWQMDHAADLAAYRRAFAELYEELVGAGSVAAPG